MSSVRIMVSSDGEWVKSPETGIFRFDGSKAKGMSVLQSVTYQGLLDQVHTLLGLDQNKFSISMKFLYASSVAVAPAEITSDHDANFFIAENSGEPSLRTPLCITVERKERKIISGEESSQTTPELRENGSSDPLVIVELSQPSQSPTEWVTTREDLSATNNNFAASLNRDDSEEVLEARQLFPSKKDLKEKLSMLAIRKNFEFRVKKSSPEDLVLVCADKDCPWRLRACRFRDKASFQIRKFVSEHSCSSESRIKNRQASSWVISQLVKSKYGGTEQSCKPKDIIEDAKRELGVSLSYKKAWRARELALYSDGAAELPRRRCLPGWPGRKPKRPKTDPGQGDKERRIRRCTKCGDVGHYSKTCSTPIIVLPLSVGNFSETIGEEGILTQEEGLLVQEEEDRVAIEEDKVAESELGVL